MADTYLGSAILTGIVASYWIWIAPVLPLGAILTLVAGIWLRLIRFDRKSA